METSLVQFDSLKADITVFVAPTREIAVSDLASNTVAHDTLKQVKTWQKKIETKRTELVAPLNEMVKRINEYAKQIASPLQQAEIEIKDKMRTFALAEERRRAEELRKIEEERREAQRKADEERKRIEAARMEEERKARAIAEEQDRQHRAALAAFGASTEATKKQADEAAATAERDRLEMLKRKAEEQARLEREQNEREAIAARQLRELEASRPKNTRKVWKFEIVDPFAVPRSFLSVDEGKIRNAMAQGIYEIPGVRIFEETTVVAR
jgi:unconventional prefoldin RPB5 interactor 1